MIRFNFILAALAMTACAIAAPYAIAQDAEHVAQYRLFQDAQARGDFDAAAVHGEAAWQAAEEALGDHELTAILAYNYGYHIVFELPEQAKPALDRAKALADAGRAELPQEMLRLLIAYAEFSISGKRRRDTERFLDALVELEQQGLPASDETARAWFVIAAAQLANRQYRMAIESSQRAELQFNEIGADNYRLIAEMLLVRGLAHMAIRPLSGEELDAGHGYLVQAQMLFPPQTDIATFDPLYGLIIAWDLVARNLVESWPYDDHPPIGSRIMPASEIPPDFSSFEYGGSPIMESFPDSNEECGIEWKERRSPRYPRAALNRAYVGTVILGYDLGDDDRVHNARIVGEAPSNQFSDSVLDAVEEWRLETPPPDRPECRHNYMTFINFIIKQ